MLALGFHWSRCIINAFGGSVSNKFTYNFGAN